jgi:hypothetical protein
MILTAVVRILYKIFAEEILQLETNECLEPEALEYLPLQLEPLEF